MDKTEVIVKAQDYLILVKAFLAIDSAYLFGSYAHGNARIHSDIDIGIFTNSSDENYFSVLKKLFATRRYVETLIEPHLFFTDNDTSGFHSEVKKGIKLI